MSHKFALIIGNSRSMNRRFSALQKPDADVAALVRVLRDPEVGHFDEVTTLIDKPSNSVRRAIAHFFARKRRDDLLLLYFSGHGVKDDRGHLYLAVHDTEPDLLRGTAIRASFVTEEMDHSRSQRQVLILDCCYSGAFAHGAKAGGVGLSAGTARAFEGNGFGRVVLTATDSVQFAWEGDQTRGQIENSIFTHYLVRGLETGDADADRDGKIGLDELYDYVYERVVTEAPRQTPGKWSYKQQGDIIIALNSRLAQTLRQGQPAGEGGLSDQDAAFPTLTVGSGTLAPSSADQPRAVANILGALRSRAAGGRALLLVPGTQGGGGPARARCGVVSALTQPGYIEGVELWRRAVLRPSDPGRDLFAVLAQVLLGEEGLPELTTGGITPQDLAQGLRETPQSVPSRIKGGLFQVAVERMRTRGLAWLPDTHLIVVVDQLEEIFTLDRVTAREREGFMMALDALARSGRIWVLATYDRDYHSQVTEIDSRVALSCGAPQSGSDEVGARHRRLPPTPAEIRQMIRRPAWSAGLRYESAPVRPRSGPYGGRGVDREDKGPTLRPKVTSQPDASDWMLAPPLQPCDARDLVPQAEDVLAALQPEVQAALPHLLRTLMRVEGDNEETIVPVSAPLEVLCVVPASQALTKAFVKARLLVIELSENDRAMVRVTHGSLLHEWARVRALLEQDRELRRIHSRIVAGAALWENKGRATDYLLQPGEPLREAEELMRSQGERITTRERAFIQASLIFLDGHRTPKTRRGDQPPKDSLMRYIELYEAWGKPDKAAHYRSMLPRDETAETEAESEDD